MKCKSNLYASTAMVAVFVLGGGAAMLQAAGAQQSDQMETVVVTGFRESLANALDKKEHSNLIMESVAPEDIGKMPDMNVAESLQRLPGVQIDRAGGEGTQIRIRGLEYNVTLLDGDVFVTGREMYQSGEGSGGGNGNEYKNSMEGIPSELISGIDVFKSPDASIVAGGMGGTINLHTMSAMNGPDGFRLSGIAKVSYAQAATKVTPSATLVGTYKLSEKFGVVASLAWDHTTTREYEMQAQNRSNWAVAGPTSGYLNTVGEDYIEPEMMYLTNRSIERKRFGGYLGIEYNPIESVTMSLKWFHTDMRTDKRDISDKLNFSPKSDGLGLVSSSPYSIDANGVVSYGTFASKVLELSTMVEEDKDYGDNVQYNAKFDNGGKFRISAKISYGRGVAHSEFAQQDQELSAYSINSSSTNNFNDTIVNNYANYNACGGNGSVQNSPCTFTYKSKNGIYPIVHYTNPSSLVDQNDGLFKSAWAWALGNHNTQTSARIDADYDAMDRIKVTAGIRYSVRALDYMFGRYLFWNPNVTPSSSVYDNWTYYQDPGIAGVPIITFNNAPERLKLVNDFFPQAGLNQVLVQDPAQMAKCPSCWLSKYDNLNGYKMQFFHDPTNSFRVDNKNWSGYFMTDLGDTNDDLHINSGVRVVHTQLTVVQGGYTEDGAYYGSASWNGVPVAGTPVETRREYTDILPSLNVIYNLDDGQKVRFSAARVMAEQNYWQLGQGRQYYYTRETNNRTNTTTGAKDGFAFDNGSAGNPNLDPYRANQIDLTYEYYFGKQGLFSAGLFWKGVESFTESVNVSTTVNDDFGGTTGVVSTYENGGGGRIQGIELSAQYAFESGFGVNVNYTYAESKTQNADAFHKHLPFPGVSNNAFTVQTYYEQGPFEGHLSYTWKGSSFSSTYSITTGSDSTSVWGVYNRHYGQVDAQLTYKFLENLALVFEGRNLGGDAPSQYLQYKQQPFTYNQTGRRFSLDLKFNY